MVLAIVAALISTSSDIRPARTDLNYGYPVQQSLSEPARIETVRQRFQKAYDEKHFLDAAAIGLYLRTLGDRSPSALYNTACSLSLSGDVDRAFTILDEAVKLGFSDVNLIQTDSDLDRLRRHPRWMETLAKAKTAAERRHRILTNPDRSSLVTEDIPRFWRAYDRAEQATQPQQAGIFQREYLDLASPGMKDWIRVRQVTANRLARFCGKSPKFLEAIRPATLKFAAQRPSTLAAFRKFKSIYPNAEFPNVVLCIGGFFGGGTVSDRNLLMSAEMYGGSPTVPNSELGAWEKTVLSPAEDMPFVIAHEMIHFQQRYPQNATLLKACIREGSADFLGEICSGSVGQFHAVHVYPYGNAHEKELWEVFQRDMDRLDRQTFWLYSGSGEGKRPDDLGYYMGYKICEAYYRNAADKKQAVHDMLHIQDFKAFLRASRYAEKFANP